MEIMYDFECFFFVFFLVNVVSISLWLAED